MSTYDSWKTRSPYEDQSPMDEKLAQALNRIDALQEALVEIIELAEEQADVDDGIPNLAMRILVAAEKAL